MTAGIGRPIRPVLYLEGKRLDNALISASLTSEIGKPSTATISLTPTNAITHIFPRTYVHLFCNDPWDEDSANPVLLFEGEVLGTGFTKNDDGRAFIIHCADVSNYWHHVRQYWFNLSQSGGAFLDQFIRMTTGGAARIATVAPYGVQGYLIQKLKLSSGEENKFLDSMIALLDDIGNISSFYQNARRRLRITDRVMRKNAGLVQNLFQLSFFSDWVQQLVQARSGETNLLGIVTLLLNIIYHEYTAILAPPFINAEVLKRDAFGNPIRKKDNKGSIKEVETETKRVIGNFVFKPHIYTLPPPTCNVLLPNMCDGIQYSRNFMEENTRMTLTPQVVEQSSLQMLKLKVFKRPQEVDSFFQLITDKNNNLLKRPKKAKYGDGKGQSSHVQEFEFMTNEERFKGINPKFQGLAPAPAMLSLSNQGTKGSDGKRSGGAPRYLHNVASYEYFMNKFISRAFVVSGLFNIRPVVGYPLLVMDDSEAGMHFVAYLHGCTHVLNASTGVASQFTLVLPREVNEIDLNRPRLDDKTGNFEFKKEGDVQVFDFDKMFDSENQPPIPDWFDDSFKTIGALTTLYQSFFGPQVRSVEDIAGLDSIPKESPNQAAANQAAEFLGVDPVVGQETMRDSPTNSIFRQAVRLLAQDYKKAASVSEAFGFASNYTKRTFTSVNNAFRFLGAVPLNASPDYEPVADTEYIGSTVLGQFTEAEVDPKGESTSADPSGHPIYNGKPIPHPYELELYEASAAKAKKEGQPVTEGTKKRSPTSAENAPTGTNVENQPFIPISYPLSENQIIQARRSIVNLYRLELENKRGFRG